MRGFLIGVPCVATWGTSSRNMVMVFIHHKPWFLKTLGRLGSEVRDVGQEREEVGDIRAMAADEDTEDSRISRVGRSRKQRIILVMFLWSQRTIGRGEQF